MPRFRGLGNPNALAALVHQETSVPETESTLSEINRRPREASNHSSHYAPASAIDPGHSTILGTSQVRSVTWDDKFLPRGFKGSKSIDVAKKNKRYQNDEELSSIPGFEDVTSFGKDRSVTPYRSQVVRDSARNQSTHASSKPFYLEPQHDNKDIVIHSGRRMPGAWSDSEIAEMRQKDDKSILNEGKAAATDQGKNQSQENRNKEASKGTASHAQDEPKQQPASQTQQGGGASVARSIKLGNGPNTGEKQPSKPASRVSSKAPSKRAKDTCSGNAPNADGDGGWDSVKNDTKPTDEQNAQGNTGWGDATGTWSNDTKSTNEQSTQDIANGLGDTTGWGDTAGAENSAEQPGWDTQDNDQQNNTDNAFGWNDDDTNTKAGADTKSDEKNEANVPSNGNWNNASWNADNGGNSANDNGAGWDQVATTNSDPAKMTKIIDATDNGQKKTSDNANSGNAATTNNNNTTNNVQDSSAQPPTSKPKQEETKPTRSRKSVSAKSVPDRYKRSTSYTSGPTPIQQSFVKSYWSQWNAPPSNADLSNAEEKLGKGTEYRHECEKPPYIDTLDKPYAVFMFHFLNKEELSQMLGIEVEVQEGEAEEAAKAEMMNLSKEELVKALLKAKAQPVEKENSPAPAKTSSDSGEKPQVRRQPSPASVQKSEENQKDSGKDPQTSQPTWDQKPQTDQQNSDKKSQASQPDWDKKSQGNQQTQNQNEKAQATGTTPTPTPFADTQAAPAAEEEDEPMTCDHCSDNLGLTWYHCDICNAPDGGYDVCMLCSNKGKRCKDSSHVLDEWMENKDTKVPGPTGLKLAVVADANTANNNAGWDTDANKNDGGNTGGDWANVDTTNNNDSGWDTGANNGDSGNNDAGWGNNDTNNDNTDWNADTNNNDSGNTGGAGWDTNNNAGWDADANKNETGNSAGEGWVDVAGTGWD
ncbi:uncharacterized protein K452DRAFT_67013 [Aplosporella prunicola CBS 121167]|uniref:ZZ-type domain-containing protein n=1 Tax=Aplosporella prunicola CBS 121167 TaxID=1176127 RepID=A0A6A6BQY7_9PEZI|nr:uncharacterized protein K452DRAFT_67013 [Aplosporella prunicola CBS 121167]KAF2146532.1 hypothetical protein K452DRAFT_67013 [Aplosporella prunicola CBS 121167]